MAKPIATVNALTVSPGTVLWLKGISTADLETFLDLLAARGLSLFYNGPGDRYVVKPEKVAE